MREITEEKLKKYFEITSKALGEIKISVPENSHLRRIAEDFLSMAKNYFKDANYFYENGDYVNAFGAINYSHAWLDAGARMGLFDVKNHDLFTLFQ
ncbi:MAG: DUF357 domain-containing protein [Thermoplasmata archaeon]|jgi:hypothetical protein|nr:DUF357 domain-containing protein [Thermoplasmata archaeon]MVT13189.1 DUF357 domain-containing protein [Euryarchaeota archaeon]MVT14279.1 DUF357 domain-containing protein [Euryarchaeota archaeon]MVT36349.1 DUF357 domain-containing protein [Euryarchaeota archaeon]